MLMEMFTMVIGRTTRPTASEFTHIWMVLATKANGKKISNMVRDSKLGMMELRIKEFTLMAKNMARDTLFGEIKVNI